MSSPLDEYMKQVALSLQGQPDARFALQWNKELKRLELVLTVNIEALFREYGAKGDISINSIPEDRKVATVTFTYPIENETSLRTLTFGMSSGLVSMVMGIAKDLAGGK